MEDGARAVGRATGQGWWIDAGLQLHPGSARCCGMARPARGKVIVVSVL